MLYGFGFIAVAENLYFSSRFRERFADGGAEHIKTYHTYTDTICFSSSRQFTSEQAGERINSFNTSGALASSPHWYVNISCVGLE